MQKFIYIIMTCLSLSVSSSAEIITVNWDGTGDYTTIQAGINDANDLDTVIVAEGTYYENINFNGKNIVLTSTNPNDPIVVESTVIDGNRSGSVITFAGTETKDCLLTGFTITNGYSYGGGGIDGKDSFANISNCFIIGNSARSGTFSNGGGLYNCDGTIMNCIISNNYANGGGGGLWKCNGLITNCIISNNYAKHQGGGLKWCNGVITNNIISDNYAYTEGGGLLGCNGTIANCLISGNTGRHGGGIESRGRIANCVIYGNLARYDGGGMRSCKGSITNCIIWGNTAVRTGNQLYASSIPTYSCIKNWTSEGEGNIDENPLFINPGNGNFRLQAGSPCIDKGFNNPPGGLSTEDLDNNPRIINATVDMGAYEAIPPSTEAIMNFTPTTLNCSSEGNWVKAHFVLPEGYLIEDIDTEKPATIDSLTIISDHMNVSYNNEGLVEIEVAFSRTDFCSTALFGNVELTVRGWLTGQTFYGTDTIRITTNQLEKLPEFSFYWLDTDCIEPDWCNGFDLDQNGTVNLADFVLLAEN